MGVWRLGVRGLLLPRRVTTRTQLHSLKADAFLLKSDGFPSKYVICFDVQCVSSQELLAVPERHGEELRHDARRAELWAGVYVDDCERAGRQLRALHAQAHR